MVNVSPLFLKGLKSVDSSIKKESDLPAADPNTPIPLKYEDESTRGGPEGLEKLMDMKRMEKKGKSRSLRQPRAVSLINVRSLRKPPRRADEGR